MIIIISHTIVHLVEWTSNLRLATAARVVHRSVDNGMPCPPVCLTRQDSLVASVPFDLTENVTHEHCSMTQGDMTDLS